MSKLMSTVDMFDLIRSKYHLTSDNQLAKKLGCTAGLISKHRSKNSRVIAMSDELAMKCAALLDMPPELILMCVHAERATCAGGKEAFERLAGLAMAHARELRTN